MSRNKKFTQGSSVVERRVNNPRVPGNVSTGNGSARTGLQTFPGQYRDQKAPPSTRSVHIDEVGGSSPSPATKFRPIQIRWNEGLGKRECPYMHRWVLNFGLFSVRLHAWHRSDDKRHMHDHAWWFWTLVLKGAYVDVGMGTGGVVHRDRLSAGSVRYRPATHRHYAEVEPGGALTLLLTGPQVRNWGFWVNGKFYRPLRFFSRHGHPPCDDQ